MRKKLTEKNEKNGFNVNNFLKSYLFSRAFCDRIHSESTSMKNQNNRNTFNGSIGFVLAAAGSAVGLGNIWRFPYLAAKDGGGLFVVIYIALAITFGFALLTTEVAIGRSTKLGPLSAYSKVKNGWKSLGVLSCVIPFIILPYYCVIGGWVLKYFVVFITGHGAQAAEDGFFTGFITAQIDPIVMTMIFLVAVALIVYLGVNKGIEKSSKIVMPILLFLVIAISLFSLTIQFTDANGETRTGLQGLKVYVVPSLEGIGVKGFFTVVMDAMGQLFYSLSIAMGIMIAYGSYVEPKSNLVKAINRIEIFDTLVAFLAGVMIIPAVFTFMGKDGMTAGPSLMFISLPKVFKAMGFIGNIVGAAFFLMVFFAALSSAVSVMEAVVSSFIDEFHISRTKAVNIEGLLAVIGAIIVCLGYNVLYFELTLPNGSVGQVLDVMDYVSNSFLMPIVAILTCVLIGWVVGPAYTINEIERNGEHFGRKRLYVVMIRYIAPILLFILFLKSVGILTII